MKNEEKEILSDPIVDEIHEIRRRLWKECGENLDEFLKMLRRADTGDHPVIRSVEELNAFIAEKENMEQEKG